MTTIVYCRGEIATDGRSIRHQGQSEAEQSTFGEKVHISSCGRLYLAKAGKGWTGDFYEKTVEAVIPQLLKRKKDPNHRIILPEILTGYFDTLLVVTAESAFLIGKRGCSVLEGDDVVGMGSGEDYAKAAVMAGQSVTDAVKYTLTYDRLSGGGIYHYKASNLKPLVEEVVSA